MNPSSGFLLLLLSGGMALLLGVSLSLNWEAALLLLFLAGGIFPALSMCLAIALWVLWWAWRRDQGVWVLPAATALGWPILFALVFWGRFMPTPAWLPVACMVSGLLVWGLTVRARFDGRTAMAVMSSLVIPVGLCAVLFAEHSTAPQEARWAAIQGRLQAITGTLDWGTEGPALLAELDTVDRERRAAELARRQALVQTPLIVGTVACAVAVLVRRRWRLVALSLALSGSLCWLLGAAAGLY